MLYRILAIAPTLLLPLALAAGDAKAQSLFDRLDEEEKWRFHPTNRPDIFIDLVQALSIDRAYQDAEAKSQESRATGPVEPGGRPAADDIAAMIEWGRSEERRVQTMVAEKRYDEAIRAADAALKNLDAKADKPEVQTVIAAIRGFREQADDAKTRNDAQAAFDSLSIAIKGILWSENAAKRLVIIEGADRALAPNDRFKDCVIVAIDTDRVDFRFHYKRKRFEFPRYVKDAAK